MLSVRGRVVLFNKMTLVQARGSSSPVQSDVCLPDVVHEHGGVQREHSLQSFKKEHEPEVLLHQRPNFHRWLPTANLAEQTQI